MTSILLFILATITPLFLARLAWKRLNQPLDNLEQPDTVGFLVKNVLIVAAIVVFGIWLGFSLIDFFMPKSAE